jgi:type III restriction enzyme
MVKPVRKRQQLAVNEQVLGDEAFLEFWNQVAQRTRFIVEFDSERLIDEAAQNIRNLVRVAPPKIRIDLAVLEQTRAGVREGAGLYSGQIESRDALVIPDVITMIQGETNLTRYTIVQILLRSGKAEEIRINPQSFITQATAVIQAELKRLMQGGLKYEKRAGDVWQVRRFRGETPSELNALADRLYRVQNPERTVYDCVEFDSTVESNFVARLDTDQRVKFYVKLPSWFTVDTPIGKYNPDWAIMMEDGEKFYLVRETKGSLLEADRRGIENDKIDAARKHFLAIEVDYDVARSFSEVSDHIWQKRIERV